MATRWDVIVVPTLSGPPRHLNIPNLRHAWIYVANIVILFETSPWMRAFNTGISFRLILMIPCNQSLLRNYRMGILCRLISKRTQLILAVFGTIPGQWNIYDKWFDSMTFQIQRKSLERSVVANKLLSNIQFSSNNWYVRKQKIPCISDISKAI